MFFCLLFVLSPPSLPKITSQGEFQRQSIWVFQVLEFSVILLQFEVVSVDALKHSLFCVLSYSALATDWLKNPEMILPVLFLGTQCKHCALLKWSRFQLFTLLHVALLGLSNLSADSPILGVLICSLTGRYDQKQIRGSPHIIANYVEW